MRSSFIASTFLLLVLTACAPQVETGLIHPNLIIIRDFTASTGTVVLDPSFGFSLNRGQPGVPPRQRAGAVARGAAFELAETIDERLRELGFDVVRSATEMPDPSTRGLIVNGVFRKIDEGYRRRVGDENSNVSVAAQVEYRAPGAAPQVLLALNLDSRQLPPTAAVSTRGGGSNVNAAARRVGYEIARSIADIARRNNWPMAAH
jgi:hypothetical protein